MYLHGGGYVIGSAVTHREFAARLALATGARVLLADYRLAPEHRFPAAVDDVLGAYRWLVKEGVPAGGIAIVGDSAGGGLALATAVSLRQGADPPPAALVCLSPWVDLTQGGESLLARADRELVLSPSWLERCAGHYLHGSDPRDPLASPLYADLGGLSPLLVLVGTEEVLFSDADRLVARAREAGVDVEIEVYDDCFHLWMVLAPFAPEAAAAVERTARFLRRHLA